MTIQNVSYSNKNCFRIKEYFKESPLKKKFENLKTMYYFVKFPDLICLKFDKNSRYIHVKQEDINEVKEVVFNTNSYTDDHRILKIIQRIYDKIKKHMLESKQFIIHSHPDRVEYTFKLLNCLNGNYFRVPPLDNKGGHIAINFRNNFAESD